jgi:hypothetical protein
MSAYPYYERLVLPGLGSSSFVNSVVVSTLAWEPEGRVQFPLMSKNWVGKVVRIRQPVCKIGLKREWFESTSAHNNWTFGIAGAYASLKN